MFKAVVQRLNMTQMIEYAALTSSARFEFTGVDQQVWSLVNSSYSAFIALHDVEDIYEDSQTKSRQYKFKIWQSAWGNLERWDRYSETEYVDQANKRGERYWLPGKLGVQGADWLGNNGVNYSGVIVEGIKPAVLPQKTLKQPLRDHYARRLDWIDRGIWSLYGGIDDEHIEELYDNILNPRGGWRTNWDFDFPDPPSDL